MGILPDLGSNAYFPSIVGEILDETCKVYFQDMLSSLSLKEAIKDESVRRLIDQAEQEITNRNFKQALEKLAEAFIKTLNSNELVQEVSKAPIFSTSRILYTTSVTVSEQTEEQPIEFQNLDNVNITLILVGMGLDVPLYLAFRTFIPQVGFNKQTGETVFNWDKLYAIEEKLD